jgi:hypothetical protein
MTATTLDSLIDTLYRHRAAHALPEPGNIGFDLIQPGIDIQVGLADTVAALLAWGQSLDQVTVTGWRHREDRVHLPSSATQSAGRGSGSTAACPTPRTSRWQSTRR